jgi:tRNA(Ile)-lysidine synthase
MDVKVEPGKYVLAVSGGVDSMVLLEILAQKPELNLVAAHFNHGIRPRAKIDDDLVARAAKNYGLPFEVGYGRLGAKASEDAARKARYRFLNQVQVKYRAKAIITAHHQDDLIETAIINLLRGTGAQGLVSISSNPEILRPLLKIPKEKIIEYAETHRLQWAEDETNKDTGYTRNYIRHHVLEEVTQEQRRELVNNFDKVAVIQTEKNELLATLSRTLLTNDQINRQKFIGLPTPVSDELVHYWLRATTPQVNRKSVKKLSSLIKTARAGQHYPINKGLNLEIRQKTALLRTTG